MTTQPNDLPPVLVSEDQTRHEHVFVEAEVCKDCGRTEAAIYGCHHCDEPDSLKNGVCWWCLRPLRLEAELTRLQGENARLRSAVKQIEQQLRDRAEALTNDREVMRDDHVKARVLREVASTLAVIVTQEEEEKS